MSSKKKKIRTKTQTFIENRPLLTTIFGIGLLLSAVACGFIAGASNNALKPAVSDVGGTSSNAFMFLNADSGSSAAMLAALVTVLVTILLGWTLLVLVKSLRSQTQVEKKNRELRDALEEGTKANEELVVAHRELMSKESQLGGFLEGTTDLIAAIDTNYRLLTFNGAYKREIENIFGTEIDVGSDIIDAQSPFPEMSRTSKELWDRALNGESHKSEQLSRTSEGTVVYFEITYNPIRNSDGEIVGACQIARDSTERRLNAENLKKERDFVNAAFEVSSALVFVLDREGRIVRFNRACELASGFTVEEVRGRVFWNVLLPAEEIQSAKTRMRKLNNAEGGDGEWLCHWVTKDEKQILISWQTSAILDEDDRVEFIVATGIDVTEKHEIETSKNRMLDILENSDDFISISDLHGNIVYLNKAGRMLLGLGRDSDISKLRLQGCHPDWAREVIQSEGIPAAAKYGSWLGNTALRTVDNVEIPTSHMILAHKNESGRVQYLSTVARNRTSEKLLEEELADARDTAIQATNLKSEFLANMSHEIRTPMNGIIGIAELMSSTKLTEEQEDYVRSIRKSGEALLTIINDILDFSKIEAGKLEFENKPFDLSECVEGVIDLFVHQARSKELELDLLIQTGVPRSINGDAGRLRQVLTNLVGNAVKFTKSGSVIVRLTAVDSKLKFEVRDSGIGISEEDQQYLFKAFGQANSSIANRFGGTGLGLAISKQLVSMMGGEIAVESEEGVGSQFSFTLPFRQTTVVEQTAYPNLRQSSVRRLLVVNANLELGTNMIYRLKSMSLLAELARDTNEAIRLINAAAELNEHFDGVIIDGSVSDLERLKDHIEVKARFRRTKVFLALYPDDKTTINSTEGWDSSRFIAKPVRTSGIVRALADDSSFVPQLPVVNETVTFSEVEAPRTGTNARILIAEDNLVNQKVIVNQVAKLGFEVELVENGKEAVDAISKYSYDVVLMDCQMPVMDGFEATRTIREMQSEASKTPIIAVTAHAIAGDRERCLAEGMDDYISKPTDQKTLKEVLDKWISSSVEDTNVNSIIGLESSVDAEPEEEPTQERTTRSEEAGILARLDELGEACGHEVVSECVSLFLNDSLTAFNNLEFAFKKLDYEELAREAHKLKGSAANMGATRLPKICENLMLKAEDEDEMRVALLLKGVAGELRFLRPVYVNILENSVKEVSTTSLVG